MKRYRTLFAQLMACAAAGLLLMTAAPATLAQDRPARAADGNHELADLMIMLQLRHAKLWYAANLANWRLAQYEAERLAATFDRAGDLGPALPFDGGEVQGRIAEAISAQDVASFDEAFRDLTNACNACHQAAAVEFIEIRVPVRSSPYSNQVFGAP